MSPCYQRHEIAPGIHADIPHEHAEEPPPSDAEIRNLQAVFAIEQMMGSWVIDLGRLKHILTGSN